MCLSTVYKNAMEPQNVVLRNVMHIKCEEDSVILTDLMDRQVAIQGRLVEANLVEGFVVVEETK